ncbi:MAG: peptide MFS transporter [Bacteroidetes bacterium]|nr:peptide MFS transporter [Bacteroidota bacterium]MCH8943010.1 peptide MFS transporter [Bacteroidota bacterium]
MFKQHPKGLYILFFTELWERFSYYSMRAILVLFIISSVESGGLGWSNTEALALYGWYTMSVYLMSIPGGILADRYLGQKNTVLIGGIILILGHTILAFHGLHFFYTGLTLIVIGVGCLKPNISTMVGGLYKKGDSMRDKGFMIFYIGINIGAFLAGISVALISKIYGWHYGFGLAGVGMVLGVSVFLYGQKYLKGVGDPPKPRTEAKLEIKKPLTKIEKDRIVVLLLSFLIVIVFWGAYEQAGGLMNLYAHTLTDRTIFGFEIPAAAFQSLAAFYIIMIGATVANFWIRRRDKGKENSSIYKMAIGNIIMGLGFVLMVGASLQTTISATGEVLAKSSMIWLFGAYFLHTIGELCSSPVALSFITKLAPAKYASLMMGIYFAMTGLGNKLAGLLGEAAQSFGDTQIFGGIAGFSILFGLLLLLFLKKLKALTHGAEELQST